MSTFDPDQFLNTDIVGASSTEYVPIPEGEYSALVKAVGARSTENGHTIIDVTWIVDNDTVRELTGMMEPPCRQSIFLDIDENTGTLAMGTGKNVALGRIREAVGLNDPSRPFNFRMLEGKAAKVTIKHRLYEGQVFSDVKAVAAL